MKGPVTQILDELSRRIAGMLRVGVVEEIDYGGTRLRVRIGYGGPGDIETSWLPWPGSLGRNRVDWTPLKPGQQVLLASPSGDLAQAVVVALLHVDSDPPPSTAETLDVVQFRSGTGVVHDAETGDVVVTGARDVTLDVERDVIVRADRHINVTVDGDATITASGNARITAARIDLN